MLRLLAPALLASVVLVLIAPVAGAQVYKWKDANGTTHYSDAPPAGGAKYESLHVDNTAATPVTNAPAPASTASAQTPAANTAAATSTGRIDDNAANRAKLCKNLSGNITLLGGSQPLTIDDNGKQQTMSDVQRRQQLATARAQHQKYCSG